MYETINQVFQESIHTKELLQIHSLGDIKHCSHIMIDALHSGNKLLICGNGGSAADAQHMAAELVVRFEKDRKALPAIALTTDSSILTAGGNDFGFQEIFSRQVEALGNPGDVLIGITTSGDSENICNAFSSAMNKGMTTICLTGKDGGMTANMNLDGFICIPSFSTARIQESHIMLIHLFCKLIEQSLHQGIHQPIPYLVKV